MEILAAFVLLGGAAFLVFLGYDMTRKHRE